MPLILTVEFCHIPHYLLVACTMLVFPCLLDLHCDTNPHNAHTTCKVISAHFTFTMMFVIGLLTLHLFLHSFSLTYIFPFHYTYNIDLQTHRHSFPLPLHCNLTLHHILLSYTCTFAIVQHTSASCHSNLPHHKFVNLPNFPYWAMVHLLCMSCNIDF